MRLRSVLVALFALATVASCSTGGDPSDANPDADRHPAVQAVDDWLHALASGDAATVCSLQSRNFNKVQLEALVDADLLSNPEADCEAVATIVYPNFGARGFGNPDAYTVSLASESTAYAHVQVTPLGAEPMEYTLRHLPNDGWLIDSFVEDDHDHDH